MVRNATSFALIVLLMTLVSACGGGGGGSPEGNTLPIYGITDTGDNLAAKFPNITIPEPESYVDLAPTADRITSWKVSLYDVLPPLDSPRRSFQNSSLAAWADQIMAGINNQRTLAGLAPLVRDPYLERLAQAHARDMALRCYFAHTTPDGLDTWDRFNSLNPPRYNIAGENSARGVKSPFEAVNGWMNSDKHRENILMSGHTHTGVGVYFDPSNTQKPVHLIQFFCEFMEDPVAYDGWYEPTSN